MANKNNWNEIADYTWKSLTDEGYLTWENLYYVIVLAIGSIVVNSTSLIKRTCNITTAGSITLGLTSTLKRLRPLSLTTEIITTFDGTIKRTYYLSTAGTINLTFISFASVFKKLSATMGFVFNARFFLRHFWNKPIKKEISWAEDSKETPTWTEK